MKRDDKESERECQARELALSPGRAAVSSPAVSSFPAPVFSGVVHGLWVRPRGVLSMPDPASYLSTIHGKIRPQLGMSSSMLSGERDPREAVTGRR